jgi:hypothetical protein
MAYKYFSQQLVSSNLDLSSVFPEKQQLAKDMQNVTYGLGDIVLYLKDITKNFKSQDTSYIELDNSIQEIIKRYYKKEGVENPFFNTQEELQTYKKGVVPSVALTVKDGETTAKEVIVPKEVTIEEKIVSKEEQLQAKINNFKKTLSNAEMLLEDSTEEEKKDILNTYKKKLVGLELILEDEPDADEFDKVRRDLYVEFINKNS